MIGPLDTNLKSNKPLITVDKILIEIGRLTKNSGLRRREAIRNLAKKYNRRSNELYKLIEESKK